MTKVTNNYTGLLNVAGTEVRPGATVEVDKGAFDKWSLGNAAKLWLKQGLVTTDTKTPAAAKDAKVNLTDREQLEARATGHGIAFTADTSDEDLLNAVLEADEAAKNNEREALLKEARDLGLNPNANTGTEKLKKLIADKKAA